MILYRKAQQTLFSSSLSLLLPLFHQHSFSLHLVPMVPVALIRSFCFRQTHAGDKLKKGAIFSLRCLWTLVLLVFSCKLQFSLSLHEWHELKEQFEWTPAVCCACEWFLKSWLVVESCPLPFIKRFLGWKDSKELLLESTEFQNCTCVPYLTAHCSDNHCVRTLIQKLQLFFSTNKQIYWQ